MRGQAQPVAFVWTCVAPPKATVGDFKRSRASRSRHSSVTCRAGSTTSRNAPPIGYPVPSASRITSRMRPPGVERAAQKTRQVVSMRIETRSPRAWIERGRLHESVSRDRSTSHVSLAVRAAGRRGGGFREGPICRRWFQGGVGSQFSTHEVTHRIGDPAPPGRDTKARDSMGRDPRKESCRWDKWTRRVL